MDDVFISYSHGDDSPIAAALEKGLKQFAAPFHKLKPALRVFRDQTDLSASPSLRDSIEVRLRKSRYLLLIASSRSAGSPWVKKEVTTFLSDHDNSRLMIVLTGGNILWDNTAGDFDWNATTALQKDALSGVFDEEPLFVDLRSARGTTQPLTMENEQFADAVATIASPIHGRPKAELYGEQARQRRRSLMVGWSTSAILLMLVIAIGLFAALALYRRDLALSRERAALSSGQLNNNAAKGAELALEAWNIKPTKEAEHALRRAVLGPFPRVTVEKGASVAISSDDAYVLSISEEREAELIELATGQVRKSFRMPEVDFRLGDQFRAGCGVLPMEEWGYFAVTSDLAFVVVAQAAQSLLFIDTQSGKILHEYDTPVSHLNADPETAKPLNLVVRKIRDKGFMIIHGENRSEIIDLERPRPRSVVGNEYYTKLQPLVESLILSMVASPDGTLLLAGREDGAASIHYASSLKTGKTFVGDGGRVCGGGFSPDGRLVVTSSMTGRSFVWDVPSGERLAVLNDVGSKVMDAYFSPQGRYVVSHHVGDNAAKGIHIWPANWQPVRTGRHPRKDFEEARFTDDGETIYLYDNSGYYRWTPGRRPVAADIAGEWELLKPDRTIQNALCPDAVDVSPDGRLFASIKSDLISLCDGETGQVVQSIRAEDGLFASLAFSPDGQFILAAVQSGKGSQGPLHYAGIWYLESGALWSKLTGHSNWLLSAEFNNDGTKVVTTAADHCALVYDTPAFMPIKELVRLLSAHFGKNQQ